MKTYIISRVVIGSIFCELQKMDVLLYFETSVRNIVGDFNFLQILQNYLLMFKFVIKDVFRSFILKV